MSSLLLPIAARRHHVVTALARGLESSCGTRQLGSVVLGLSGGVDSTAMLLATCILAERTGWKIEPIPVHVNHHLRDDADRDADHASGICEELGLNCHVVDVYPEQCGEEARVHRYEALMSQAGEHDASWILAAHHAEDQLETIIAALGRGAGPTGLSGMAPRRPLGDGAWLIRPMLQLTKSDLQSICKAAGVSWREDPTNQDPSTLRGRLRRDVLPVLEELWPGAARRSAVNADVVRAASEALAREVEAAFGDATSWTRAELRLLDPAIRVAGFRWLLGRAGLGADSIDTGGLHELVRAIDDGAEHGRRFEFADGISIQLTALTVCLDHADHGQ